MSTNHFPADHQGSSGMPGPQHGFAYQSFPAVTTMLGGYDFHSYALHPSPASLLRGRSAGVATSPTELLIAAGHQPADLPVKVRRAGNKAKWAGISLGGSFFLFLTAGFYLTDGPVYPDLIGGFLILSSFLALFSAVYFGVAMVNRMIKGPKFDPAASRQAIEESTGIPLENLPVIYVGARQLHADERVLLQQMSGFYNLLQERGYPMTVDQWKSLTNAAVDSVRQHRINGDLGMARSVGATISEWVKGSEQAVRSRTEFTTRGIVPPQF